MDEFKNINGEEYRLVKVSAPLETEEQRYVSAVALMNKATEEYQLSKAIKIFEELGDYKDSKELSKACKDKKLELSKEKSYKKAIKYKASRDFSGAIECFKKNPDYKDSEEQIKLCEAALAKKKMVILIGVAASVVCLVALSIFLLIASSVSSPTKYGVRYEKTEEGYIAIEYDGEESDVVIPDEIWGKPVISIGDIFENNNELESIEIGDNVSAIKKEAFSGCQNLEEVRIGNGVKFIGEKAFAYCPALKQVKIGKGVTRIYKEAFYNCSSLKKVVISDGLEEIGENAFGYCVALTEINIPDSVETIDDYAFAFCEKIKNITLNGVQRIRYMAFYSCTSLESVTLGKEVSKIDEIAFSRCDSLSVIKYRGSRYDWEYWFEDFDGFYGKEIIYNYTGE